MVKKDKNIIINLAKLSKYFGQRYDLIQAAGGNSSIKVDKKMFIKSSGYSLAELSISNGYSKVDNQILVDYLSKVKNKEITRNEEDKSFKILKNSLIYGGNPSIETLAHSILKKYTIHLHPIAFNMITVQKNSNLKINKIFKREIESNQIYYIKYKTPGVALAKEIFNKLKGKPPKNNECCFILENHGIIASATSINKLISFTELITEKAEKSLNINFEHYKKTTEISTELRLVGYKNMSVLCSEDLIINNFLKKFNISKVNEPLNPDSLLYCGLGLMSSNGNFKRSLLNYKYKYRNYPRVIKIKERIYFVAENILKAKEIEDVFKSHLYLYSGEIEKRSLSKDDIKRLESYNPQKNRLRFWFDYEGKKEK